MMAVPKKRKLSTIPSYAIDCETDGRLQPSALGAPHASSSEVKNEEDVDVVFSEPIQAFKGLGIIESLCNALDLF